MADHIDMDNRDPNNINEHLKVTFDDVIGEPDGVQTIDCCWKLSFMCFNGAKTVCYNIMALFCSCPIAFCWGCEFAFVTFVHVWHITPCLRAVSINCACAQKFCGTCLQCCLGPICETSGLVFSNIMVRHDGSPGGGKKY